MLFNKFTLITTTIGRAKFKLYWRATMETKSGGKINHLQIVFSYRLYWLQKYCGDLLKSESLFTSGTRQ